MKFLSWSLHAPSSANFDQYKQKINGEWVTIDPNAPMNWGVNSRGFLQAIELYHEKIYAIGLHDFGVANDGTIYNYKATWLNVLNSAGTAIQSWVPTSLRYLMETYPNIKWSLQTIAFGDTLVNRLLDNTDGCQDTYIDQLYKIAELYLAAGYPIAGIETDFEKVGTREGDAEKYRDLLIRTKQEVCIPLGLEDRVNLYAMTGVNNPSYYGWHSYPIMAQANCDEYQLMTYDFAWAGSAPGPSTPVWWLQNVMSWVAQSLPPDRTFIGNAAYGRRWNISVEGGRGATVTYKQLIQWQNGLFKHNEGSRRPDGSFWWVNQPFLPWCGTHDDESHYQKSYLHVYDMFREPHIETVRNINRGTYNQERFITSYFKRQRPVFGGVLMVLTSGVRSGETSLSLQATRNEEGLGQHTFQGYTVRNRQWAYDENRKACVPALVGWDGEEPIFSEDGKITYMFNATGNYRLIALVSFPTYGADTIGITVNSSPFTIGGENLEDWYPFYVLGSHFYDCGSWNFSGTNTIEVGNTNQAVIYGFIVCQSYDQNNLGGVMRCTPNIQQFYERDEVDGKVLKKRLASLPEELTVTAETIRRVPRPVIIWEDNISPHVNQQIPNNDLTRTAYYRRANPASYSSGSGPNLYWTGEQMVCISQLSAVGFSSGEWIIQPAGYATCSNGQLILDKRFSCNIHAEVRLLFETGQQQAAGMRFLASQRGNSNEGYLFLVDYRDNTVKLIYNGQVIATEPMSAALAGLQGSSVDIRVTVHNNRFIGVVGNRQYFDMQLPTPVEQGAWGAYVKGGQVRLYNLIINTTDRYEPMEKLAVKIDEQTYTFGEVPRSVGYDQYGYLEYSGLNVRSTELEPYPWDLDYRHSPLATVQSWQGSKEIEVQFVDAGIWLRSIYVGDAEGFSVAWNGDAQGFIRTVDIIRGYNAKGIGMWALGQEDMTLFTYLPDANREESV